MARLHNNHCMDSIQIEHTSSPPGCVLQKKISCGSVRRFLQNRQKRVRGLRSHTFCYRDYATTAERIHFKSCTHLAPPGTHCRKKFGVDPFCGFLGILQNVSKSHHSGRGFCGHGFAKTAKWILFSVLQVCFSHVGNVQKELWS